MSWLLAFLGFALLIILHELGHFVAAKAVGMRVERFSLFFPPKLFGIQRGETEYMIGAIPLGGYVRITGMNPDEELPDELRARSYAGAPVWKRIVVIAAGPLVNLVVAFLILWGVFLADGQARPGVAVGEVQRGTPAAGSLRTDDLILAVEAPGARGTVQLPGDAQQLSADEAGRRISAIVDLIARGGCDATPTGRNKNGSPTVAECNRPGSVRVTVQRDGARRTLDLTPRYDADLKRYRLGLAFASPVEEVGVAGAAGASVTAMWRVTRETVRSVVRLFYDAEARKEVSGVTGSYEATRQSIEVDPMLTLRILALISLSLAVINLFPFLPLDGGHIFWAVVERARGGRPVSTATLERASMVGILLVMALFFIGLNNDLGRILSGEGFGIR